MLQPCTVSRLMALLVSSLSLPPWPQVYRRYLKLEPTHAEEFIAYLRIKQLWGEAARVRLGWGWRGNGRGLPSVQLVGGLQFQGPLLLLATPSHFTLLTHLPPSPTAAPAAPGGRGERRGLPLAGGQVQAPAVAGAVRPGHQAPQRGQGEAGWPAWVGVVVGMGGGWVEGRAGGWVVGWCGAAPCKSSATCTAMC